MDTFQAKNLFQIQNELVDMKVEIAVSKAIDLIILTINELRHDFKTEIYELKHEMRDSFSSLDKRVVAIETRLSMKGEKQKAWYDRTLDVLFKSGWAWSSFLLVYFVGHFHISI